jgi:hypothetical protein
MRRKSISASATRRAWSSNKAEVLPAAISRASCSAWSDSAETVTTGMLKPCRSALRDDRLLPLSVLGPVLLRAFARFASSRRAVVTSRYPRGRAAEAEAEAEATEAEAKEPEAEAKEPEAEAKQPEAEVKQPEAEVKQPEAEVKQPATVVEQTAGPARLR